MNEQVIGAIRILLITVGTSMATKYGLDQNLVPALAGAVITVGTAAWSLYMKRQQGLVNAAAGVPGVKIVAPDTIANATPATNVVPASQNDVVTK